MARPIQKRVIQQPPKIKGFSPMGYYSSSGSSVKLNLEEYEVIRLLDYEDLTQEEASVHLNVSRPTLTRIYESARRKVAHALIEPCRLLIEGGTFVFRNQWYSCNKCLSRFNNPNNYDANTCPLCGNTKIEIVK